MGAMNAAEVTNPVSHEAAILRPSFHFSNTLNSLVSFYFIWLLACATEHNINKLLRLNGTCVRIHRNAQ